MSAAKKSDPGAKASSPKAKGGQRGGFVLGLVVGLLLGLAAALGVALYVTKVPIPFVNKLPQRTPEQDAAEAERNKNWDPNAPLAGKPVKPVLNSPNQPIPAPAVRGASDAGVPVAPNSPANAAVVPPRGVASAPAAVATTPARPSRDPGAILNGQPVSPAAAPMVGARSAKTEGGAFTYFVQAGAFARAEDAEQQRAKLAMMGFGARVTEREQAGRTVYRVRLGPFERKDEADTAQEKLAAASVESALVRVENAPR
jgi:cell division protein FtsN